MDHKDHKRQSQNSIFVNVPVPEPEVVSHRIHHRKTCSDRPVGRMALAPDFNPGYWVKIDSGPVGAAE